jgi:DNA-binding cell septation regulator SpoVG
MMTRTSATAGWGSKPQPRQARIVRFTEYRNPSGTMLAFFSAELPSGMIVHGLKLMVGPKGRRFVGLPAIKRRDGDDRAMLDPSGKGIWDPVIEFSDRASRDRFGDLIIETLRVQHPQLFDGEGVP